MTTAVENSPYSLTAAGDLGCQRESMLDNELLLKTELGRPKRRGCYGPQEGFTFGRPNDARNGGATDALHGWSSAANQKTTLPFHRTKEKKADRDFLALNKSAVGAGLITAGENYNYRATHDVRKKMSSQEKQKTRPRIPPSMVFGLSTRPSTPIFDLLEHKYQDMWLNERRKQELAKRQEETKQKRLPGTVYETRASLLRTYQNPVDPAPLWQLSRFTKSARPHLQTFRSTSARQNAFKHFETDQISRKGNPGHGAYQSAKN